MHEAFLCVFVASCEILFLVCCFKMRTGRLRLGQRERSSGVRGVAGVQEAAIGRTMVSATWPCRSSTWYANTSGLELITLSKFVPSKCSATLLSMPYPADTSPDAK